MTFTRSLLYFGSLTVLFGTIAAGNLYAQSQKSDFPSQKNDYSYQKRDNGEPAPSREQQREQAQGGYQAPAPTGALRGPMREMGISGGEIELPALRLRLPRFRLPAFTMFMTPPQMETERAVAPLVQQFQEQTSIPTGSSQREQAQQGGDGREQVNQPADKQPFQKANFQGDSPTLAEHRDPEEMVRMRDDMDQLEHRIDQKLELLADSINTLVAQQQAEQQIGFRETTEISPPARLPVIEGPVDRQVRPSSYLFAEPAPRRIYDEPRRLPPVIDFAR